MSAKRINPRLIKLHRAYSVEEAAKRLDVHKNTVREWIEKGLPIVDKARPTLINGHELRRYLEAMQKARKRPCPPGTCYCFKCRAPSRPAMGMVDYIPTNEVSGNLRALCDVCGTMMHRRARRDAIAAKMPNLDVHFRGGETRLTERSPSSLNHDNRKDC